MPTRRNQNPDTPRGEYRKGGPPIVQPVSGPFSMCRLVASMDYECPSQHLTNPLLAPLSSGGSGPSGVERYTLTQTRGKIYDLFLIAPKQGTESIDATGAVYLYGAWKLSEAREDQDIDTTKRTRVRRLDDFGSAGITFSFVDSAGAATTDPTLVVPRDDVWIYSINALAEPIDLQGADEILTVIKTKPDLPAVQGEAARYAELWAVIGPN